MKYVIVRVKSYIDMLLYEYGETVALLKPSANERIKTRNKKQNGLAHPRFIVCITPKQKTLFRETLFRRETCFHRQHVRNKDQFPCFSLSTRGVAD